VTGFPRLRNCGAIDRMMRGCGASTSESPLSARTRYFGIENTGGWRQAEVHGWLLLLHPSWGEYAKAGNPPDCTSGFQTPPVPDIGGSVMAKSTRPEARRKPEKPSAGFPMFAHPRRSVGEEDQQAFRLLRCMGGPRSRPRPSQSRVSLSEGRECRLFKRKIIAASIRFSAACPGSKASVCVARPAFLSSLSVDT
jgi:hypothetical protein